MNPLQGVIHSYGTFKDVAPPEKPSSNLNGTDSAQILAGVARLVNAMPDAKSLDSLLTPCSMAELHHFWHACRLAEQAAIGMREVLEAHVAVRNSSTALEQIEQLVAKLEANHG